MQMFRERQTIYLPMCIIDITPVCFKFTIDKEGDNFHCLYFENDQWDLMLISPECSDNVPL